ncbi:MAG TPA: 3'-5' exonuclease [Verrucomicrobiae bacterium]|nr:3'-5' exonuclease [Verrucomicrobiae bacterium]
MTITAHDFETEGLIDFTKRSHDPSHPHIVSMAIIKYADDGTQLSCRHVLAKPVNGSVSQPDAFKAHGITEAQREAEGIPEEHVISLWLMSMARATLRVAHNGSFDDRVARIALTRYGFQRDVIEFIEKRPSFCTMNNSKAIVNLPPTERMVAKGINGPKPPNLAECVKHFFPDEAIEGLHGALADARYAGRIYFHLKSLGKAA